MAVGGTKVVQVTNIAPQATKDQMQTLFGYLGKIEDIRLYPTIRDVSCPVQSRICYIKFMDSVTVGISQHMTNTVFIDRALIVIPVQSGDIPDEYYALEMTKNGTIVPGLCPQEPKLPPNVVNTVIGTGSDQVIVTTDPQLEVNVLPLYPALPANYDSCKIEEIRRTILIPNVDSSLTTEDFITFFKTTGEIKYIRFCSRASDNSKHVLIEFSEQPSIIEALKLSGKELKGKVIKILHSVQAIVKPQAKSNEAAQREIEEAMSRVKEAQSLISAAIDPVIGMLSKDKRSSRRSRSRSRGRRRRSRSRSRSRHRKRSNSPRSRRSRSRERRRRSRSRSHRSRSRGSRSARSRSRRSRSRRSRSKSHVSSTKSTTTKRNEKEHRNKSRERSKDRSNRSSREKEREKERDKNRDRSRERRSKDKDRDKIRESTKEIADKERDRTSADKKRSRSSSRYSRSSRSRSRERRTKRERRRSRSRTSRRRSPSPRKHKRSRSRSRDRTEKKKERKDRKERSPSRSKVPRNYDEEEKGFDSEKERRCNSRENEKDSSEKSDNMDISNSP